MNQYSQLFDGITIAFVGGGAMGGAIIGGVLSKQLVEPAQIVVTEPRVERGRELAVQHAGIQVTTSGAEAVSNAEIVVLAVKPQVLPVVLPDLRQDIKPDCLVVSIIAGAKITALVDGLGVQAVVRSMPNTPAQIGQGITAWLATAGVSEVQRQQADLLLCALGETLYVTDEKYLDMATALSGSGPGYVFLFIEALIDAGVQMGFARADAEKLALQTVIGSAAYMQASGKQPTELRHQVTSPGGTTAAGLYELEKSGLRTAVADAVMAAFRRSVALGNG